MTSKMTAAERAYRANPGAIIICFQKSRVHNDLMAPAYNQRGYFAGQPVASNFDQLMGNSDIKMIIVNRNFQIVGKCVRRSYNPNVRVSGTVPLCHYILRQNDGMVQPQNTPVVVGETHCWQKKFFRDHNLRLIAGGFGNGIMLAV
jgi:hypothetical protein